MGCYQVKNNKAEKLRNLTKNFLQATRLDKDIEAQTESSSRTQKLSSPRSFDCHSFTSTFRATLKNLSPKALSPLDQNFLAQTLSERFIFSQFSIGKISQFARKFKSYSLANGQMLISEGEFCDHFLYLKKGFIEVLKNGLVFTTLKENQGFGELSFMCTYKPLISLKAGENCEVWLLSKEDYKSLIKNKAYFKIQAISQGLQNSKIFSSLDAYEQELLINTLSCIKYNENEEIKRSNDLLYIIGKGKVGIYSNGKFECELVKSEHILNSPKISIKALTSCVLFELDISKESQNILYPIVQQLDKEFVKTAFLKSKILQNLNSQQQDSLINCTKFEIVPKGEKLLTLKSELNEFLLVIIKGEISFKHKTVGVNSCLGVDELYKNSEIPNFSNWIVTKTANLGLISVSNIQRVLGKTLFEAVSSNITINLLKKVYFFKDLSELDIESMAIKVAKISFKKNESIYKEGNTENCFYILIKGRVKIYKDLKVIKQVSKHGVFGESCLIQTTPRTTAAVSKGATCLVITKSNFIQYLSTKIELQIQKLTLSETLSTTLQDFIPLKVLGTGTFGTVFLCQNVKSNSLFAMKSISKSTIAKYGISSNILSEKKTIMYMNHPFIVNLFKTYKSETRVYFLLEYVPGIEFFELIQKFKVFDITEAKFYSACLVLILEHLHERKIVYRDLKPENIMIDLEGYPKLVDFGMAKIVKNRTCSVLGTPHYMAPEVVKGLNYGSKADFWSLGVILYQLLTSKMPFGCKSNNPKEIYDEICTKSLDFQLIKNQQGKDIIEKLLSKAPDHRGDWESIKETSWFSKTDFDDLLKKRFEAPYKPNIIENMNIQKEMNIDEFLIKHEKKCEDYGVFDSLYNF